MNLSPMLLQPKTLVLLDPTSGDGESSLELLEAHDTHVSLVVLMYGPSSGALHAFADAESIDLSSAASIYLDQVADRIASADRVVETIVSGGSNPASEMEYLASHTPTRRVLVPSSLPRQWPAEFARFTRVNPELVVAAGVPSEDAAHGGRWSNVLRSKMPAFRRVPDSLNRLPFADRVPASELRRMSKLGRVVDVAANTEVIGQGAAAELFLVVIDGSFTVVRDGVVIADLGPGQIAGEMALLSGSVCNASVVASAGASVLELGRNEFATLLETCPGVSEQVQQTASRRLAHTA